MCFIRLERRAEGLPVVGRYGGQRLVERTDSLVKVGSVRSIDDVRWDT
jgi:hypothetical protein